MPRGSGRLVLDDFTGGLNVRDDPVGLPVNESPSLQDFVPYGEGGAIVQRDGDSVARDLGSLLSATAIVRLFWSEELGALLAFDVSDGGLRSRVHAWRVGVGQNTPLDSGVGAYSYDGDDFSPVAAPVSGGQGPVYFRTRTTASAEIYRYWTGSGAAGTWTASAGTIPSAQWFLYVGNRVWGFKNAGAISAHVWWSELGDPRNWPAANVLQLEPGSGEGLTGAGVVGDLIVVFKYDKAWTIYDLDTGANRALTGPDVGARDMQTICATPLGLFFLDPGRGPMVTDGTSAKPLDNGTKVPWSTFEHATYFDDHIYCTVTSHDALYDYYLPTRSWFRHTSTHSPLAVSNTAIYASRYNAGVIDQFLVGGQVTFASGAAILPFWDSPHLALGATAERKRLRSAKLVGASSAALKLKPEVAGSFTTLNQGAIEAPGLSVPTPGVARAPQFEVLKVTDSDPIRLDQLVLDYSVRQK